MSNLPDWKQTAKGFKGIWKRYERRAGYLLHERRTHLLMQGIANEWNHHNPRYSLGTPSEAIDAAPSTLARDVEDLWAQVGTAASCGLSNDLAAQLHEIFRPGSVQTAIVAIDQWQRLVNLTAQALWPEPDFPNSMFSNGHPAQRLVGMWLHCGPVALQDDPGRYIERLSLKLQNYYTGASPLSDIDEYSRDSFWYIPVYPGITAEDLRAAATSLAEQARSVLGDSDTSIRIVALANDGLRPLEIAQRLGLEKRTVTSTLRYISNPD